MMRLFYFFICFFIFYQLPVFSQPGSIVTPKDNQVLFDYNVLFSWNHIEFPVDFEYIVQGSSDENFNSVEFELFSESNLIEYEIEEPGKYFWRIGVITNGGDSQWISSGSFAVFSPANLTGLELWLKADNAVLENGKVVLWQDASNSEYIISQTDQNLQPDFIENSINNLPAVKFDGVNDFLNGGDIANLGLESRVLTLVGKSNKNSGTFIAKSIVGSTVNRFGLIYEHSNLRFYYSDNTNRTISVPRQHGSYEILSATVNRQTNLNGLWANGIELGTSPNNSDHNMDSGYNFLIGAYNNSSGSIPPYGIYLDGEIAELIICDGSEGISNKQNIENYLRYKYFPDLFSSQVDLGFDLAIDGLCSQTLDAGIGYEAYLWSTGESSREIEVNESGKYWVEVVDQLGISSSDTIYVKFPETNLTSTSLLVCEGDSESISPGLHNPENFTYEWNTGESTFEIEVSEAGSYWVIISDSFGCFAYSDTVNVEVDSFPEDFTLGINAQYCSGNWLHALSEGDIDEYQFIWSTGSEEPAIEISESGNYAITITNPNGCTAEDEIFIEVVGTAPEVDFSASVACVNTPTEFADLSQPADDDEIVEWLWNFGDGYVSDFQNPSHTYEVAGLYTVSLLAISESTCQDEIYKIIEVLPAPEALFETVASCINVPVEFNDLSIAPEGIEIDTWYWNFGNGDFSNEQNPQYQFSEAGDYNVELTVTSENGCEDSFLDVVNIVESSPLPFESSLVLPKNNAVLGKEELKFQTNPAINAEDYLLQVSQDESFESAFIESEILPGETVLLTNLDDGQWFARVIAYNICRDSVISGLVNFEIFSPSNLEDLSLWLKAENVIANDENYVSVWQDLSSNHFPIEQSETNKQPKLIEGVLNGNPVLRFDGNQFLDGGDILDLGNSSRSYFIIGKFQGGNSTFFSKSAYANIPDRIGFIKEGNNFVFVYHDNALRNLSWSIEEGLFYMFEGYTDKNISENSLIINNVVRDVGLIDSEYEIQSDFSFLIGAYANSTGGVPPQSAFNLKGDIAEIIFIDRILEEEEKEKLTKYFQYKYSPPVNLSFDKVIPYGFCPITLDAGDRFESYIWSTGDTTQQITVNEPGVYSVRVTDIFGFESEDEVKVVYPEFSLSSSGEVICLGEELDLSVQQYDEAYDYLWSTGQQGPSVTVDESGTYTLTIADSLGCYRELSAVVEVDEFELTASLGEDRPFCMGDELGLEDQGMQPSRMEYLWNTGATTSTIVIEEPGTYSLHVVNDNGCEANPEVTLSFQGYAPQAGFEAEEVCPGEATVFEDLSTVPEGSIESWYWEFGDGSTSGLQSPEHNYAEPGINQVSLTVTTTAGCENTFTGAAQVYFNPEAWFTPNNACSDVDVNFNDQSVDPEGQGIGSWQWDFGDGNQSTEPSPVHSFSEPGTYQVQMQVTALTGCSASLEREMKVRQSPEIDFDYTSACYGEPVYFTDNTQAPAWAQVTNHYWDFGDGSTSTQMNPSHLFEDVGVYPVTLSVQALNGCQISLTREVTVHAIPSVSFSGNGLCQGAPFMFTDLSEAPFSEMAQWQWDFAGLGTSTEQNPWFTFHEPGQYQVSLQATSEAGCQNSVSQLVEVYPAPEAAFSFFPRFGVSPLEINFSNQSIDAQSYLWDFGDGSPVSTEAEPSHTYLTDGIYYPGLVAYSSLGCPDTTFSEIKVIPMSVDVALTDLNYSITGDFINVDVRMMNLGTRDLDGLQLQLQIASRPELRETWAGMLRAGESTWFTFSSQLPVNPSRLPDYLCVEASIPGVDQDDDPENDILCHTFESSFKLLPPRPNPASHEISLGVVLPRQGEIEISFSDITGHSIGRSFRMSANEGISFFTLPISHLPQGMYLYRVDYLDKVLVGKFVVSGM